LSPTASSVPARLALAAALLLPPAFLSACSAMGDGDGCRGTGAELERLAAEPLLTAAPAEAAAPANYRGVGVTTGCDDDSGGSPWLHADRLYTFPGSPEQIIAHYAKTASMAGWHREKDRDPEAASATAEGACWTKADKNRHLLLSIDFHTDAFSPEPDAGRGLVYAITVGTETEDSTPTC
jgi:hypothetical protein